MGGVRKQADCGGMDNGSEGLKSKAKGRTRAAPERETMVNYGKVIKQLLWALIAVVLVWAFLSGIEIGNPARLTGANTISTLNLFRLFGII